MLYMVTFAINIPPMLAYIYQHHGSYGYMDDLFHLLWISQPFYPGFQEKSYNNWSPNWMTLRISLAWHRHCAAAVRAVFGCHPTWVQAFPSPARPTWPGDGPCWAQGLWWSFFSGGECDAKNIWKNIAPIMIELEDVRSMYIHFLEVQSSVV